MKNYSLIFLFSFCSFFLVGQVEEGKKITKELCSEVYFGRGYIKGGDSLAALFLADKFKEKGLKPLKKGFLQPFEMSVNTFPGKMLLKVNDRVLDAGKDYIVDPYSGSAHGKWQFIQISAVDLLDPLLVRNLIDSVGKLKLNAIVIDFTELKGDSLRSATKVSYSFCDKVYVLALTNEKFTFSVADQQFKYAYVKVQESSVDAIYSIETAIEAKFKEKHIANNVLAYIPGKNKKKYIVFTAHYDHLGGMGAETYFPGANDNASGTSMLMALADYYKVNKPKYNIAFMAFAGEEAGLLGSHYFVTHPQLKLDRIRFLINLDIMGSGEEGITVVNGAVFTDEFDRLTQINSENNYLSQIKKRGKTSNSDHYFFTEAGVPSFFIYTMGPNKHYHDVFDTYKALSFSVYNEIVSLLVKFVDGF